MTTLPLAGYRVLELAHLIAGPACGMYLADMGADVVKIEQPTGGDASRTAYGTQLGDESAVFVTVNRNKRSVALDLARPEGLAAFDRLVALTDVVIEAYRGGVAERLGIDWPRLARINPRLVYCSLSAFGPDGPWRDKPGVDMLVQAMGGLMAVMGEPDGPPLLCGAPVLDTIGALMAGQGILTALLHRERTGEGQRVDVSLLGGRCWRTRRGFRSSWRPARSPAAGGAAIPISCRSRRSRPRTDGYTSRSGATGCGRRSATPSRIRRWPGTRASPRGLTGCR